MFYRLCFIYKRSRPFAYDSIIHFRTISISDGNFTRKGQTSILIETVKNGQAQVQLKPIKYKSVFVLFQIHQIRSRNIYSEQKNM